MREQLDATKDATNVKRAKRIHCQVRNLKASLSLTFEKTSFQARQMLDSKMPWFTSPSPVYCSVVQLVSSETQQFALQSAGLAAYAWCLLRPCLSAIRCQATCLVKQQQCCPGTKERSTARIRTVTSTWAACQVLSRNRARKDTIRLCFWNTRFDVTRLLSGGILIRTLGQCASPI